MLQVWMLILTLTSFQTFASHFGHIKLNSRYEQYLNQAQLKSGAPSPKSLKSLPIKKESEFDYKIRVALLGANGGAGDFNNPLPRDGEESPLYEQIRHHLDASHREIGLREVAQLDFFNQRFNLGTENLSGFSWQKPYGVVHVHADRQVVPNLFGNNWLIQDTFTFDIEATTFLERANEAGITDMSAAEIAAFAGITFKRSYTYYHYAQTYNEGLRADFSKLFLPFVKFNQSAISRMGHDEVIKRQDDWAISAGGMISTPPYYGFSFSGGILAQLAYQNIISIQHTQPLNENAEKIRLSAHSKKTTSIGANLSLQVDFFKLLKLTILNYDLSYEYASSREFTLALNSSQWEEVTQSQTQSSELRKILLGHHLIKTLVPYIIELDESESSALSQRGSLLVWGKLTKNKTEQVRVIKDQEVKLFFKNYNQNIRVVQNIWGRLFSAIIYKIFKFPLGTKNAALYNRQINMQYEATHPQSPDPEISRIDSTEQFSFILNQSYEAARTDRWIDKSFKNDLVWFVDSFTTLSKDFKALITTEQLKGPMLIESILRVEKAGFDFLLHSSEDLVFGHIAQVCESKRAQSWQNESQRAQYLKNVQIGAELCVKEIGQQFIDFKNDFKQSSLKPSIRKFKNFISKYFKKAKSLDDLVKLFGEANTFIHGQLRGVTSENTPFVTSFSSGQFRGLGVIDNYKRSSGSRLPASIISE